MRETIFENVTLKISIKMVLMILAFGLASICGFAQTQKIKESQCYQDETEKLQLIKEAESGQFTILHIEISGNTFTRFRTFRKYMSQNFNEGYIFTQETLMKNIISIGKINGIFPINFKDVEIYLNQETKQINIAFCVVEKRKN